MDNECIYELHGDSSTIVCFVSIVQLEFLGQTVSVKGLVGFVTLALVGKVMRSGAN